MNTHQFVIWGAGRMFEWTFLLLGKERIAGIVDSDTSLHGTTVNDISIFSYEEYKKNYSQYPIIVTPQKYTDDICKILLNDGVFWAYSFWKESYIDIQGFCRQAPLEQLKSRIKEKKLVIAHINVLGILLYDYFVDQGFEVCFCKETILNDAMYQFANNALKVQVISIKDINQDYGIIINKNENTNLFNTYNTYNYVALGLQKDLYNNPALAQFKNLHKGKRCFLVGCGPSLKIQDLDTLHTNNEICISCNGIIKAFNQTQWRPNYYCIADVKAYVIYKKMALADKSIKEYFFTDAVLSKNEVLPKSCCHKVHAFFDFEWEGKKDCLPKFSDNIENGTYSSYTVIYDLALQVAVYMGFTEIYLLGCDCTSPKGAENKHFVKDYDTTRTANNSSLNFDGVISGYKSAKQYADAHGIKIYNATRGGALEVFERVNFDTLFEDVSTNRNGGGGGQ